MKLYYFESPNPRLACAAARQVGAAVELVRVDLIRGEQRRPDYLALNPNGRVPTLVDGDRVLWEAPAIAAHLAQRQGSDFWPGDAQDQIELLRWLHWNSTHFTRHAIGLFFEHVIKPRLGLGEPGPAQVEEGMRYFHQFAQVLERQLEDRDYLVADRLSLADFAVAMVLPWAEESQLPLQDYARIRGWYARIAVLPAWREPYPAPVAAQAA